MQALLFSPHPEETGVFQLILQQAGFIVRTVQNLDRAIESWPEQPSDLVLISLSGGDSSKYLPRVKQIRAHTVVPIVAIADVISEDLQIDFLQAGVDLLVLRPYSVRLLLAQIRTILRSSSGIPFFSLPTLTQRDVVLDPATRTVTVGNGQPKHLTQLEFRLLYTLMTHAGQIIPTERIIENVWGYSEEGNRELVRGLVQRLRAKIEPSPRDPQYILTELGVGYFFSRYKEIDP